MAGRGKKRGGRQKVRVWGTAAQQWGEKSRQKCKQTVGVGVGGRERGESERAEGAGEMEMLVVVVVVVLGAWCLVLGGWWVVGCGVVLYDVLA